MHWAKLQTQAKGLNVPLALYQQFSLDLYLFIADRINLP